MRKMMFDYSCVPSSVHGHSVLPLLPFVIIVSVTLIFFSILFCQNIYSFLFAPL